MIRRAFWLAIGAALGAAGYRKASQLGTGGAARFVRDVRAGMADYQRRNIDRQHGRPGNTLARSGGARGASRRRYDDSAKDGR